MSARRCPMPGPDGLACEALHPEGIDARVHHAALPGVEGAWVRWDYILPAQYMAPQAPRVPTIWAVSSKGRSDFAAAPLLLDARAA